MSNFNIIDAGDLGMEDSYLVHADNQYDEVAHNTNFMVALLNFWALFSKRVGIVDSWLLNNNAIQQIVMQDIAHIEQFIRDGTIIPIVRKDHDFQDLHEKNIITDAKMDFERDDECQNPDYPKKLDNICNSVVQYKVDNLGERYTGYIKKSFQENAPFIQKHKNLKENVGQIRESLKRIRGDERFILRRHLYYKLANEYPSFSKPIRKIANLCYVRNMLEYLHNQKKNSCRGITTCLPESYSGIFDYFPIKGFEGSEKDLKNLVEEKILYEGEIYKRIFDVKVLNELRYENIKDIRQTTEFKKFIECFYGDCSDEEKKEALDNYCKELSRIIPAELAGVEQDSEIDKALLGFARSEAANVTITILSIFLSPAASVPFSLIQLFGQGYLSFVISKKRNTGAELQEATENMMSREDIPSKNITDIW